MPQTEQSADKIVILTGAGISAESGLGTFRDAGGLWAQHRIEDVATPEGFARNPALVHQFYNARRIQAAEAKPNPAHNALRRLTENWPGEVVLVSQNVDGLHEAAGCTDVIHMHGQLDQALCATCGHRWVAPMEMQVGATCPQYAHPTARPDIVWFGEMPYHMEEIYSHLAQADVFTAIGTSGQIYPAAGFVDEAQVAGALTVELNLEPSAVVSRLEETYFGPASKTVSTWVDALLREVKPA
ncbi:NAD-dependent deacylase [Epibacterium ulvae]|uniref:NAD-dependent deacylase n=1 Tax=Epibacterium ulvae TaxID=1156985 RepID=UPI001BFC532A|nr:NAD-dependent deacylase [Epibacterium ulvae]MBT8152619.1 NAD-dependent deacylase [Epibacterium ulvae]